MILEKIVSVFTVFFLQNTVKDYLYLIPNILYLAGLYGVFRKSGIKGWYALIPCLREVKLGEAVGMEKEGRVMAMLRGLSILTGEATLILSWSTDTGSIAVENAFYAALAVQLLVEISFFIYMIRIGNALCEVYDRKKRWTVLWVTFNFIPALMWGWMKKYQPLWKVEEMKSDAASFFSGSKAEVLDQGLTVNLEERTATEFFKKKYLLRDIHMYIEPGHMVLLLGGSGAGKTTYLNAVNGYEKAKAEVVLNGRNMYKDYKDMQYDIGFVPQQDLMRGSDTVFRTLMDAATLRLPSAFTKWNGKPGSTRSWKSSA